MKKIENENLIKYMKTSMYHFSSSSKLLESVYALQPPWTMSYKISFRFELSYLIFIVSFLEDDLSLLLLVFDC